MINEPVYLGDAVYAVYDGEFVTLRTGSHRKEEATNEIHLDHEVFKGLVNWRAKVAEYLLGIDGGG